jgi:multiple RNA-binding domain-containing protein 1
VCIKNLPPKTTERDLKEYLLAQGKNALQITDCKILKNDKGESRKVAFVGFRNEDQAKHVIETFHRAFLNMTRITVEPAKAKKVEDDVEPRHVGTDKTKESSNRIDDDDSKKKKNAKVEELLSLMGAGSKPKFWSNDVASNPVDDPAAAKEDASDDSSSSSDSDSSDDDDSDMDDDANPPVKPNADDAKSVTQPVSSDLDFLRSKQKSVDDLEDDDANASSDDDGDSSDSSSSSSSSDKDDAVQNNKKNRPTMDDTTKVEEAMDEDENDNDNNDTNERNELSDTRLFVRNLPFEATEDDLSEYFSTFGKLVECHIPVDDQKRNKGYAFVTFESPTDATEAMNQLDKVDFQGRLLHILRARPPPASESTVDTSGLSWKQKQELLRKEQETKKSGETSKGWSASFVRGDAVVDNLAERLGLRKGDLLGVKDGLSSGDAAVRLALGETQIIEENREYFREHGVDMDVLVSGNPNGKDKDTIQRSKESLLVKNLPFDTRLDELEKLFHIGDVRVNILLPPSRTIALVEFEHSTDAKKAFRKLAYRKFKHVPIYLEWAPLMAMKDSRGSSNAESNAVRSETTHSEQSTNVPSNTQEVDDAEIGDESEEVTSTLYVKNLNFQTTEESLKKVFEDKVGGRVISVRIPRKVAPTKQGASDDNRTLSMGYGFVELPSTELAKKAIKVLQGKLVDGHALEIAISSKRSSANAKSLSKVSGSKAPTKLMVRNVPFQATRKEILKLFGTFGQLRKVRLPKKFDGSHRGFAFVEFLTGKEALAAMTALSQTHLYGRHLVLEWASDEDDNMDRLRDKAKRDAGEGKVHPPNKKIRFE